MHSFSKMLIVAQSCLTLCNPMDYSPPGSSVHGILQAKILEWVAISFSRGSSQPRNRTHISFIGRQILYHWATGEDLAWWLWMQSDWQIFSVDVSPLKFRRSESPQILQKTSRILKQREMFLPLFFGRNCLSLFDATWYPFLFESHLSPLFHLQVPSLRGPRMSVYFSLSSISRSFDLLLLQGLKWRRP